MTEYWLQKRGLAGWTHVTWYEDYETAKKNFDRAAVPGNGYSWRMVKVDVVEEKILEGERKAEPDEDMEETPIKMNEGSKWSKEWDSIPAPKPAHGLAGKVWLVNHNLKEKKRVDPIEVDAMIAAGWVRGGPRTVV